MNDTELYTQILGLPPSWQVADVTLDPVAQEVRIRVAPAPGLRWSCPECDQPAPGYDLREERRWRHLDICEFTTWVVSRLPRIECPTHGIKTVVAPWMLPHSRLTVAFNCFAQRVLQATQQQTRAAALLRLTPAEVHPLMDREDQETLETQADAA